MIRFVAILPLVLAASAAGANTVGCGDNAFSRAEVVSRAPNARAGGPVTTVPESLCAELIEDRPRSIESLSVHIGERPAGTRPGPSRSEPIPAQNRAGAPRRP